MPICSRHKYPLGTFFSYGHKKFSSWSKYKKYQFWILTGYSNINYHKGFELDVLRYDVGLKSRILQKKKFELTGALATKKFCTEG